MYSKRTFNAEPRAAVAAPMQDATGASAEQNTANTNETKSIFGADESHDRTGMKSQFHKSTMQ